MEQTILDSEGLATLFDLLIKSQKRLAYSEEVNQFTLDTETYVTEIDYEE